MHEFSFQRDLKKVDWAATFKLNTVRAAALGLLYLPFALVAAVQSGGGGAIATALLMPVWVPLYFLVAAPFYLLALKLLTVLLPEGIGALIVALLRIGLGITFVLSDPLVYLLKKRKPEWVPSPEFKAFNFAFMIFVVNEA